MDKKRELTGLTDAEVLRSRAKHGANVLTPPAKEPVWKQFLEKFTDPLIIILLIAGTLSIGISCWEYWGLDTEAGASVFFEPIGIFIAILLATGIAFYFERQADKEFAILNQVNDDEPVEVLRNGITTMVPKRDLVVGDIVLLDTGSEVPADGRLVEAVSLYVDESTLNGESVPSLKSTREADFDPGASYPTDMVLRGTKVMDGHGVFRVTAVGDETENGKVYVAAQIDDSVKTPLNKQLDGLSLLITKVSYILAGMIIAGRMIKYFDWEPISWLLVVPTALFFLLVSRKFGRWHWTLNTGIITGYFAILMTGSIALHNQLLPGADLTLLFSYTLETLMIAVTVVVVAVPEGLPMAVTLSLAYNMRRMLKTSNLVRKMHASETMGAITVICTDKTGTLTQNRMSVAESRFYGLGAEQTLGSDEVSRGIKEGLAVNSTADLDESDPERPEVLGNPTEGALILWLRDQGIDYRTLRKSAEVIDELPFSTERKYMATLVRSALLGGKVVLYVKGAPEIVYRLCSRTESGVTEAEILQQLTDYQSQAMRTLGFAYKVLDAPIPLQGEGVTLEGLTFQGIVAISDPVREDVKDAVEECLGAGIDVKIVTGDTPATAREIGRQIGLWSEDDGEESIITGKDFAALTDEEVDERVTGLRVIARARPMDKKRLVESLQRLDQVVAVTGDGTNDAPALKAAHVGLSMGDGTSVAKEASDITIIDNSFSSIGKAVMWGRSLYQNIQRFLLFQLTVNLSACLIVLVGAMIGTESPLTVTQMLWVNLIMDTFAAMALASLPPSPSVMRERPRDRDAFIITRRMGRAIIAMGGVFFLFLLALLYHLEHADVTAIRDLVTTRPGATDGLTPYELTLFFTTFVMLQFFNLFNARAFATGRSALHFKGCRGLLSIAGVILLGQIALIEIPGLQRFFNTVEGGLSLEDWLLIIGITSLVLWIPELGHQLRRLAGRAGRAD